MAEWIAVRLQKNGGETPALPKNSRHLVLEYVADFGVDGEVRRGDAVDVVLLAVSVGEIKIAADVVVLVVVGEELLGLGFAEAEGRQGNGDAKAAGKRFVTRASQALSASMLSRRRTR